MSPLLPRGHRIDDGPKQRTKWSALKFRLALAARKYPIQISLVVSLLILSYPVILLIDATNDLEAAQKDLATAQRNLARATTDIQASRSEAIRRACEDQNKKNKDTSDRLTALAQADINNAKTRAAKTEIRRRRDVTLALIDALAPSENCDERVQRLAPDTTKPTVTVTPTPTRG